ncbi:MAG: hypothetical protein JO159_01575 [Acidobacteria bacterium]|nr:hypothetical protein [Acidobacteriota bacterium]
MVQEGNKTGDGALKVDVVFPERVVGINQQILPKLGLVEIHLGIILPGIGKLEKDFPFKIQRHG